MGAGFSFAAAGSPAQPRVAITTVASARRAMGEDDRHGGLARRQAAEDGRLQRR
jgi:hypothetical protein